MSIIDWYTFGKVFTEYAVFMLTWSMAAKGVRYLLLLYQK